MSWRQFKNGLIFHILMLSKTFQLAGIVHIIWWKEVLLKELLASYASSYSKVKNLINLENNIISHCIKLLKPFEETTKKISASTASVSYVIPLISTLRKHFEPSSNENDDGLKRMKDVIKLELKIRFSSVEINDLHTIAIYLDPR